MVKIREMLATGLAVIACMAIAFGIITNMRNKTLSANLELAAANNQRLAVANEVNANAITELVAQRQLDEKIIESVFEQYQVLKSESRKVYNHLEELKRNDKVLQDMLSRRHPASVTSLLNARTDRNSNGSAKDSTTSRTDENMPSTEL